MTRRRVTNGHEQDATSRWCRRYLTCFQRPGYARYGKNMIVRRERREAKQDIRVRLAEIEEDKNLD